MAAKRNARRETVQSNVRSYEPPNRAFEPRRQLCSQSLLRISQERPFSHVPV